ncbi:hypothetical protein [Natronorarus salvus]|uniref:hypothetical protein n=1 Tax=Natronorarus salvus TaxID=3117733 RepID=UPI002F264926
MGRRRFVETLVGAGFSAAMASCLSASEFEAADDEEVPIVYAHRRADPADPASIEPVTKLVPARWYDELRRVFETHASLDLAELEGVVSSAVSPGSYEELGASIRIDTVDAGLRDRIAGLLEDTPFDVSVVEGRPEGDAGDVGPERTHDLADGVEVPGGVACSDGESMATLTPALYDRDRERVFFATANHLYGGEGDEMRGEECRLITDDGTHSMGVVERGYREEDIALVRPTEEVVPTSRIAGELPGEVVGTFTKLGLADLKARGAEVRKTGARTGLTSGSIEAIDGVSCIYGDPCKGGQVKWGEESDFLDGDSGSVCYHPDPEAPDDGLLVCGVNKARTWWPGENYVWGTAAYVLEDRYGYTF